MKPLTKSLSILQSPDLMTKLVIIGAGPCGIGAGYRLWQEKSADWQIYEKESYIGGLAAGFKDDVGFTWDVGGHVMFSHYKAFDDFVEHMLQENYISHLREAYIWCSQRWIPYPFQNNIRYLPIKEQEECILGLIEKRFSPEEAVNFKEWSLAVFGRGISRLFMEAYNYKVWATPLEIMAKDWIGERVSVVDIKRILSNVLYKKDDISWGPNNKFKFPLHGGTGGLFSPAANLFDKHLSTNKELIKIDWVEKEAYFGDGTSTRYDKLITTMPINLLCNLLEPRVKELTNAADELTFTSGYIVGIGLKKRLSSRRCWMYFPQSDSPFYRVTNFAWYSYNNVPQGNTDEYSSLMCETSYSDYKRESKEDIIEKTIQGLINSRLMQNEDRDKIVSSFLLDIDYSYPVPTLKRDRALFIIQNYLEKMDIYSRGRFGGWRYEVGNMDHSFMMGYEIVNRLLLGTQETVYQIPRG